MYTFCPAYTNEPATVSHTATRTRNPAGAGRAGRSSVRRIKVIRAVGSTLMEAMLSGSGADHFLP
ncbi:hypothetical protein GCM10010507_12320 [Streptomyces cinnamoneus]|uniref:Uncharacterized protein n=1 Tax=Streptomyces cinnamoneus TaxID=53446 RepID=A0A918TC36_STRCJ|nr:hypothetical protein GCM10010507_12320 [Streptomyces cinnamoneus]